jgi:hypothetical protein
VEDNRSYLQALADELLKWGAEIDELKTQASKVEAESRRKHLNQVNELRVETEIARDNLIRVFLSLKNQDHSELAETTSSSGE